MDSEGLGIKDLFKMDQHYEALGCHGKNRATPTLHFDNVLVAVDPLREETASSFRYSSPCLLCSCRKLNPHPHPPLATWEATRTRLVDHSFAKWLR